MATGCVTQNEHGICEDNTDIMWTYTKSKEVSSVPIDGAYTATTLSRRQTYRAMWGNIGQAQPCVAQRADAVLLYIFDRRI